MSLALGAAAAAAWAKAIATPPPSLRAKLGLAPGPGGSGRALLVGACDDAALAEALAGVLAADATTATMVVARIAGADDLAAALAV